jgi:hypothetical protein
MKYKTKTEFTYEVKLYLGSREGYHGKEYTEDELVESIGAFQSEHSEFTPVRITKTRFVDRNYNETGWELAAICYPRQPRTKAQLLRFMSDLAGHLLEDLKQSRISMMTEEYTTLFESEKAEKR